MNNYRSFTLDLVYKNDSYKQFVESNNLDRFERNGLLNVLWIQIGKELKNIDWAKYNFSVDRLNKSLEIAQTYIENRKQRRKRYIQQDKEYLERYLINAPGDYKAYKEFSNVIEKNHDFIEYVKWRDLNTEDKLNLITELWFQIWDNNTDWENKLDRDIIDQAWEKISRYKTSIKKQRQKQQKQESSHHTRQVFQKRPANQCKEKIKKKLLPAIKTVKAFDIGSRKYRPDSLATMEMMGKNLEGNRPFENHDLCMEAIVSGKKLTKEQLYYFAKGLGLEPTKNMTKSELCELITLYE